MEKEEWESFIFLDILSFAIIVITFFLIFIYIKVKDLHSYPCYFNIFLCASISIDNILRLIPFYDNKKYHNPSEHTWCKAQGFLLALFDKLMLTTMTIYSIISFLCMAKYNLYEQYEKFLYIALIIIGILISLILAIIFMLNNVTNYADVCYVRSEKNDNVGTDLVVNKKVIDIIATTILLVINIYCISHTLVYLFKTSQECKTNGDIRKSKNYLFHFWKYLIDLILTIITFIVVILIVADKLFTNNEFLIGFSYVFSSLLVVIFFSFNIRVFREAKRLILCQKERQKTVIEEENDDDDDNGIEISNIKKDEHLVD